MVSSAFRCVVLAAVAWGSAEALTAVSVARQQQQTSSPVGKVISLLSEISEQIRKEGAAEAAEYDKFACFCKDQADKKTYQIERSEKEINRLQAQIDLLGSELIQLEAKSTKLGGEMDALTLAMGTADTEYLKKKETYEKKLKEVEDAIKAVADAIAALREIEAQGAKKLFLAQLADAKDKRLRMIPSLIAQAPGSPKAYEYSFQSVFTVLQDLSREFEQEKKEGVEQWTDETAQYERTKKSRTMEHGFKKEEKSRTDTAIGVKTETKETAENDQLEEIKDRDSDKGFRDDLTVQCQDKAENWDQRSKSRANELTAMAEAIDILKKGAAPNYKIAGLQQKTVVKTTAVPRSPALSLLQVFNAPSPPKTTAVAAALKKLGQAASRLKSPVLSAVLAKASLHDANGEDMFEKVRQLMTELIQNLQQEATDEEGQQSSCDQRMQSALDNRDKASADIENEAADEAKSADDAALCQKEAAQLAKDIAEATAAITQATEVRANEKKNNDVSLSEARAGLLAVGQAIEVLTKYYDNPGGAAALVQNSAGPDRDGNTVADTAPELSYLKDGQNEYSGKTELKDGVIGLLRVIHTDFENAVTEIETSDGQSEAEYMKLSGELSGTRSQKEAAKKLKEDCVTDAQAALMTATDNKMNAQARQKTALTQLEQVKAECVEGEDTFAERAAKREQEIQALQAALKIIENWGK